MKTKILALLLCALMLAGIFSGCGKETASEGFLKLSGEIGKIQNAEFSQAIGISISPSALTASGITLEDTDTIDISFNCDGVISKPNKQMNMDITGTFSMPSVNTTVDITSVFINENDVYMDVSPIFKLISMFSGEDMSEYSETLANKYVTFNTMSELKVDAWTESDASSVLSEELGSLGTLLSQLMAEVHNEIHTADPSYITEEKGGYSFTMNTDDMKHFAKLVFTHIRDNADKYCDGMIEYAEKNPSILEDFSYDIEGLKERREEGIESLKSSMDEAIASIDAASGDDIPDMLLKYTITNDKKTYAVNCEFSCADLFTVKMNQEYNVKLIDKLDVPDATVTLDEFYKLIGVDPSAILDEIENGSLPSGETPPEPLNPEVLPEDYGDYYDDGDYPLLPQNIIQSGTNSTITSADVAGYPLLTTVTLTDSAGTPTSFPIPSTPDIYESDSYASSTYGNITIEYGWDYLNGADDVTELLNSDISYIYGSMVDYIDSVSEAGDTVSEDEAAYMSSPSYNENIWLSANGGTALSSVSYTAFGVKYCNIMGYIYSGYDDEYYSINILFPTEGLSDSETDIMNAMNQYLGTDLLTFAK